MGAGDADGRTLNIAGREVGIGESVYIVAELSANHNHDLEHAVHIIRAAKEAGADAVKLQTYTADTITLRSDKECFRVSGGTLWDGRILHDLYQEAFTPWEWQPKLKKLLKTWGWICFPAPSTTVLLNFSNG